MYYMYTECADFPSLTIALVLCTKGVLLVHHLQCRHVSNNVQHQYVLLYNITLP